MVNNCFTQKIMNIEIRPRIDQVKIKSEKKNPIPIPTPKIVANAPQVVSKLSSTVFLFIIALYNNMSTPVNLT